MPHPILTPLVTTIVRVPCISTNNQAVPSCIHLRRRRCSHDGSRHVARNGHRFLHPSARRCRTRTAGPYYSHAIQSPASVDRTATIGSVGHAGRLRTGDTSAARSSNQDGERMQGLESKNPNPDRLRAERDVTASSSRQHAFARMSILTPMARLLGHAPIAPAATCLAHGPRHAPGSPPVAGTKKGPVGPFFVEDALNGILNVERETRLELATSTLARLRSTN